MKCGLWNAIIIWRRSANLLSLKYLSKFVLCYPVRPSATWCLKIPLLCIIYKTCFGVFQKWDTGTLAHFWFCVSYHIFKCINNVHILRLTIVCLLDHVKLVEYYCGTTWFFISCTNILESFLKKTNLIKNLDKNINLLSDVHSNNLHRLKIFPVPYRPLAIVVRTYPDLIAFVRDCKKFFTYC